MRSLLATIIDGEADFADLCFLIAVILFAVVAVLRFTAKALDGALVATGAAVFALGWLVL